MVLPLSDNFKNMVLPPSDNFKNMMLPPSEKLLMQSLKSIRAGKVFWEKIREKTKNVRYGRR